MRFDAKAEATAFVDEEGAHVELGRRPKALAQLLQRVHDAALAAGRTEGRDEGLARAGEIVATTDPDRADAAWIAAAIKRERTGAGR